MRDVPRPADRENLTYLVESSSDLVTWSTAGVVLERVATGETEVWRGRCSATPEPRFLRLRVSFEP